MRRPALTTPGDISDAISAMARENKLSYSAQAVALLAERLRELGYEIAPVPLTPPQRPHLEKAREASRAALYAKREARLAALRAKGILVVR